MFKNIFYLTGLASILLISQACNNDLDPNADYKDIPVVYALLDPGVDTQYVRIHKSFLGNLPIEDMAQIPDSIYYNNMQAVIEELINDNVTRTFPLNVIENRKMDEGFFTTEGFKLYYTTESLNPTATYRIVVSRPGQVDAVATTELVNTFTIQRPPFNSQLDNFLDFSGLSYEFRWRKAENATSFTVNIDVLYREQQNNNRSLIENKRARFSANFVETNENVENMIKSISMQDFFTSMENQIPTDPSVNRYLNRVEVSIVAGHTEIERYVSINSPQSGINQELPLYTNVNNGVGLFSSRRINPSPNEDPRFYFLTDLTRQRFAAVNNADKLMCGKRFVYIETDNDSTICDNGNTVPLQ